MSRAPGRLNVLEQAVRSHDTELWDAVVPLQEWSPVAVERIARAALRSDNVMAWQYLQKLPGPFPCPTREFEVAEEGWWHVWALEGVSTPHTASLWWEVLASHSEHFDAALQGGSSSALGLALEKGCLQRATVLLEKGASPTALLRGQPLPLVLVKRVLEDHQSDRVHRLQWWSGYEEVTKVWSSPVFPLLARSVARWGEAFDWVGRRTAADKLVALQEVWAECRLEALARVPAQPASPRVRM